MEPPVDLLPLGPFPPRGPAEQPGRVDLGALLRDQLLCRRSLEGPLREGLQARLARALEGGRWAKAAESMVAWLDTWPVAAAVDPARSEWSAAPSAPSLAVLARAGELAGLALGWPPLTGTPWPRPPARWIRSVLRGRLVRLLGRGPHDHREVTLGVFGGTVAREEAAGLPPMLRVRGERLVERRAAVLTALERGEAVAVVIDPPVPDDPATVAARADLRAASPVQRAVEAYGPVGAWVAGFMDWRALLEPAPPGERGAVLQPVADSLLSPGTPEGFARGELADTGWLVWAATFRPAVVRPAVVEVLRALDGERDSAELARILRVPRQRIEQILEELVDLGAATAA